MTFFEEQVLEHLKQIRIELYGIRMIESSNTHGLSDEARLILSAIQAGIKGKDAANDKR